MKILKVILVILAIIITVPLITALFLGKDYTIERGIVINRPKQDVFNYVKNLRHMEDYTSWYSMDPNIKKEYKGEDGTVGFISSWESKNDEVGSGWEKITRVVDGERLDVEIHFIWPVKSESTGYMTTENAGTGTKVKWGFHGHMNYPLNLMLPFIDMDRMAGDEFAKGLIIMKSILEDSTK